MTCIAFVQMQVQIDPHALAQQRSISGKPGLDQILRLSGMTDAGPATTRHSASVSHDSNSNDPITIPDRVTDLHARSTTSKTLPKVTGACPERNNTSNMTSGSVAGPPIVFTTSADVTSMALVLSLTSTPTKLASMILTGGLSPCVVQTTVATMPGNYGNYAGASNSASPGPSGSSSVSV